MKIKLPQKYIPVKIYKVVSRSEPGLYHSVVLCADGSLYCNCIAGSYKKMCFHQIRVREHIQKNEPEKNLKPIKQWQKKKTKKNQKK